MLFMRRSWFLTVTLSLLVGSGCSDAAKRQSVESSYDHGHSHEEHDHGPESLKDAISELTTLRDVIRDSFAQNDQDAAHGPLHEVGEILEAIPKLSEKEKVGAEKRAAIQTSADTLMDAFGRVDKTMHGQEGSTYAEESATIDAALTTLIAASDPAATSPESGVAPASGEPSAAEQVPAATGVEAGAASHANGSK